MHRTFVAALATLSMLGAGGTAVASASVAAAPQRATVTTQHAPSAPTGIKIRSRRSSWS